jgi:prepilin-type N-terminal cleavage/methylation domain-containing protein/prepilin-type processing-associated H-X9-DG protein
MKSLKKGFTLIELLVVIAIIAILAAILFPVFAQVRNKARQTAGEMNIRQISYGILQYMQDNEEKGPRAGYDCRSHIDTSPASDATLFGPGEGNQCGGDSWQDVVGPYIKSKSIFLSPGDQSQIGEGPWGGGTGNDGNPSDGNFSLLYNDLLAHKMAAKTTDINKGFADPSQQDPRADGIPLAGIKDPTQCLLICEGHGGWDKCTGSDADAVLTDWTGSTNLTNKWHQEWTVSGNCDFFMSATSYSGLAYVRIGLPFYNGGGNVAYVDGHQHFALYSAASGQPAVCKQLPWNTTMDPAQRVGDNSAGIDQCRDTNNPVAYNGGWTEPNWF